jgi:hypothetical protein
MELNRMRRLKTTIALWYLYIVGGIKAIFRVILTDEDFTDEHYEMMLRGLAVKKQKSKK